MSYDCGTQSGIKPHVPLGQAYFGARVAHLKWPEQRQPPRGHPAESVYRCNQCRDTVYCCIIRNYLLTYLHAYLPTYLLTYLLTDLLTYLLTYLAYHPTSA